MAENKGQIAEEEAAELKEMKLRENPEYCRLWREANTISWESPDHEAEWKERRKACRNRRKKWGQYDCDERGSDRGNCEECTQDIAEVFETDASRERRLVASEAKDALEFAILKGE